MIFSLEISLLIATIDGQIKKNICMTIYSAVLSCCTKNLYFLRYYIEVRNSSIVTK